MKVRNDRPEIIGMIGLSALFLLRVAGQALVSRGRGKQLPPMEQWQSGLLPYPALLGSQVAILAVQAAIDVQARRGEGSLVAVRPRFGRAVYGLSIVYFGAMVVRYIAAMRRHPDRRWFGKTIPIIFHCILATYLFLYARLVSGANSPPDCLLPIAATFLSGSRWSAQ